MNASIILDRETDEGAQTFSKVITMQSSNGRVNYDQIAQTYHLRFEKEQYQGTQEALRRLLSEENTNCILEVGCGTGHWLNKISSPENELWGLDASMGMLRQAGFHVPFHRCQGTAEQLPFDAHSFDLIFCVNALHHFIDQEQFIRETFRVLKQNSVLAIIGMDPSDLRNQWYIYDFFQGTRHRDLERFPKWKQVEQWLKKSGFTNLSRITIERIHDPKTPETVLQDPFLKKNSCSQLTLLSTAAYQEGLKKIRESLPEAKRQQKTYPNDIVLEMQIAYKKFFGSGK